MLTFAFFVTSLYFLRPSLKTRLDSGELSQLLISILFVGMAFLASGMLASLFG